jgi:hypothetical protein
MCGWHAPDHRCGVPVCPWSGLHDSSSTFGEAALLDTLILNPLENFINTADMTFRETPGEYSCPEVTAWHTVPVGNRQILRG